MNMNQQTEKNPTANLSLAKACLASCRKLVAQIKKAKDAVLAEFSETRDVQEQLLRLALNEAEALAWQTEYPHLVFPTLAMEKAQAVAAWGARQRSARRMESARSLAV